MKKIIKKHYKIILGLVIGILISATVVYASQTVLSSDEVSYNTGTSHGTSNNVQGAIDDLYQKINSYKEYIPNDNLNRNIVKAYKYDENSKSPTYCINGEEDTCFATSCYENKAKGVCPVGTIIEYMVNNEEKVRFHVVHDDGEKLTLQSQKNIIHNIVWNDNDISKGPITALTELEEQTKNWNNVNELNYSIGDDTKSLGYSGCAYNYEGDYKIRGEKNIYILDRKKVKARMITAQEAGNTGCLVWKNAALDDRLLENSFNKYNCGSCPDFMHNYLKNSIDYGGSYNGDDFDESYWTMSVAINSSEQWFISNQGILTLQDTLTNNRGVRAVVEINK